MYPCILEPAGLPGYLAVCCQIPAGPAFETYSVAGCFCRLRQSGQGPFRFFVHKGNFMWLRLEFSIPHIHELFEFSFVRVKQRECSVWNCRLFKESFIIKRAVMKRLDYVKDSLRS